MAKKLCILDISKRPFLFKAGMQEDTGKEIVVRPGAPSSVLAPSSDARSPQYRTLLLVVRPGAPSSFLLT